MSVSTRRRWGVPAAAATAVLAVVGVSLLVNGGTEAEPERARLSGGETTGGCAGMSATPGLEDYERVAVFPHGAGELSFWVDGDRWLVCDDVSELAPEAAPDVWAPPQELGADGFDEEDLAYRSRVLRAPDGSVAAVHLVAAGKLMTEMETITYTFADGHREDARIVEAAGEQWWFVTRTATDGPLVSEDGAPSGRAVTGVSLLTPSADTGTAGPMIGGAAQAFADVPRDRTPSLLQEPAD